MKIKANHSLSELLKQLAKAPKIMPDKDQLDKDIESLQLSMLRIQQGIIHKKERVVIIFEGFDAAGKGGAIRALTEALDPRNIHVVPIGPPTPEEAG